MWRRRGAFGISLAAVCCSAALAAPASALGSAVQINGGRVSGGAGEQNVITVVRTGTVTTYTDSAGITTTGNSNCTQDSATQVSCSNAPGILSVFAGDGNDRVDLTLPPGLMGVGVSGGDGDDVIDGSKVSGGFGNEFAGYAGDDTVIGSPGSDTLDNPGGLTALPPLLPDMNATSAGNDRITAGAGNDLINATVGADTVDAGEGDDNINTIGVSSTNTPQDDGAVDSVICGGGNDTATLGQGDQLGADCELVGQFTVCPPGGPDCVGTAIITAAGGGAAAAGSLASAAKKKKKKQKVLGKSSKTRLKAGQSKGVTIRLRPGSVNSALRGRSEVAATLDLGLAKVKKGRTVGRVNKKVRFKLKR